MSGEIINRVAKSPLVEIDLAHYYHHGERLIYDLKTNLYQGLVLKERDFRAFLKTHDWASYTGKNIALTCSADAIVPIWAYLLLATHLEPYANKVVYGDLNVLEQALFQDALRKIDLESYRAKKVIIKGCSHLPIPASAYVELVNVLKPVVQSLMYGEACSSVPVFKRPKNQ